ncbi:extracellular protein [Colletotrichum orchidophilum]|uniref:Extracellular protein n=1 Tax=Colletotrichum orchidophilum TaxID=1209926 RepID=A0A1G4B8T6_9PEZI|nr:extracellular protein [Colletotrichum orchidophilum]OHE97736.1 extracellular protein [Colletotrichum orchidophilum]
MAMTNPPPIKAKGNPNTSPENTDFSYTNPMSSSGSDFPCKGYLTLLGTPEATPVDTWNAGGRYSVTISGQATHAGGSCQISVSVDGGNVFKVIRSYIGGCPRGDATELEFRLPIDTPSSDQAILAWTWFNNLGNREMYMNCAVIRIAGGGGRGEEGIGEGFSERPEIFRANVGNGCRTEESRDVMIPNPGPDVELNNPNAAPPIGDCEPGPGATGRSGSGLGSGGQGGQGQGRGDAGTYKPGNDWPAGFNPNSGRTSGMKPTLAWLWLGKADDR